MSYPPLILRLPDWTGSFLSSTPRIYESTEDRMRLVLSLARQNVEKKTGGPFGAAVFNKDTGELISPGVNIVTESSCSMAHAEIMALSLAQKLLGSFDLSSEGLPHCELYTSTAPCAMCLGAVPWSGIRRLVCGAADEDARAIGFDEGAKVEDWTGELEKRGIEVITGFLRSEAVGVLTMYKGKGGVIYNPKS